MSALTYIKSCDLICIFGRHIYFNIYKLTHILLLKMHPCLLLQKYIQYSQHWVSRLATSTHKSTNLSWKGAAGPVHVRNISHKSQQFLKLKVLAPGSFVRVGYIVNIGHSPVGNNTKGETGKTNGGEGSLQAGEQCVRLQPGALSRISSVLIVCRGDCRFLGWQADFP